MKRGRCTYCGLPAAADDDEPQTLWWHDTDEEKWCNVFTARFEEDGS